MKPKSLNHPHADPFQHFMDVLRSPDLPESSISFLQSCGRPLHLARGEAAELREQEQRTAIFVSEGAAKLVGHVGADREQIVAFCFEGELLILSVTSHTPYTLQALTECRLLAFPAGDLITKVTEATSSAIVERTFLALDQARDASVLLGRKTAQEKLASFLVSMIDRIGVVGPKIIALDLPMSRREIGDCLGLTIETVSRQLTALRNHGIIKTYGRSKITILDMARLSERAVQASCTT